MNLRKNCYTHDRGWGGGAKTTLLLRKFIMLSYHQFLTVILEGEWKKKLLLFEPSGR
jgi:hypothetical protein